MQHAESSGISTDFGAILHRLWQRRLLLATTGLFTAVAAIAALQLYPPRYASDGLLYVENRQVAIPELGETPAPPEPSNAHDETALAVLRSRAMLERVVRTLDPQLAQLDTGPRLPAFLAPLTATLEAQLRALATALGVAHAPPTAAQRAADAIEQRVRYLQKHVVMDMGDSNHVVSVHFEATRPDLAAAVVNGIMTAYISADAEQRSRFLVLANQLVQSRVAELRAEVATAEQRVQEYRRDQNLLRLGAGALQAVQLNADQTELAAARDDLSRREAALAAASGSTGAASSPAALASPVVQGLRQREAELLQRSALASQRLGLSSLDKTAIDEQLRVVRAQIDAELRTSQAALARDADIARQRVHYLESAVAQSQGLAAQAAAAETTLGGLEKDVDVKRQIYNAFVVRAESLPLAAIAAASARVVSPGIPPARSEPAHAGLIALLGFCGGILLAAAGTILRGRFDDKVHAVADLAALTGLPTLGVLPRLKGDVQELALRQERPAIAETLRALRARLMLGQTGPHATTILVTSSESGEGKTTIAVALARRLAADGYRVLLVEADFRRPRLAALLDLPGGTRLEDVLQEGRSYSEAVQIDRRTGMHCLPASGIHAGPLPLPAEARFTTLVAAARLAYQIIIIDSPPALRVVDPVLLARLADLTLFVVRANRTRFPVLREALRRLAELQRGSVVLALNQVTPRHFAPMDYYQGYDAHDRPMASRAA